MSEPRLTIQEAAERLHVTPKTLYNWRYYRKGPTSIKPGRKVLYRESDIVAYERLVETRGAA